MRLNHLTLGTFKQNKSKIERHAILNVNVAHYFYTALYTLELWLIVEGKNSFLNPLPLQSLLTPPQGHEGLCLSQHAIDNKTTSLHPC